MTFTDKVLIDREELVVTVVVQAKVTHQTHEIEILDSSPLLNQREQTLVLEQLANKHLP